MLFFFTSVSQHGSQSVVFPSRILATEDSCPSENYRKLRNHTVTPPSRRWAVYALFVCQDCALHVCVLPSHQSDKGNYYTAWSTMSTMIRKGLVIKYSHPPRSAKPCMCMWSLSTYICTYIPIHVCTYILEFKKFSLLKNFWSRQRVQKLYTQNIFSTGSK